MVYPGGKYSVSTLVTITIIDSLTSDERAR